MFAFLQTVCALSHTRTQTVFVGDEAAQVHLHFMSAGLCRKKLIGVFLMVVLCLCAGIDCVC